MGISRDVHVLFLVALNALADAASFPPNSAYTGSLGFEDALELPDAELYNDSPIKRLSSFVRIGRGLSSFVRIGKSDPDDESSLMDDGSQEEGIDKRKSAFVRIGRGDFELPEKRMSKFVRIGRDMEDADGPYYGYSKRGAAFLRMGKFPLSAYIRHRGGRIHSIAPQPYYRRSGRIGHSSFIRIGKRDTADALKQAYDDKEDKPRYLRLGKDLTDLDESNDKDDEKRMSSFVRIGRPDQLYSSFSTSPADKRLSHFVRIGKSGDYDKRMSSFVRIGKSFNEPADEMAKRLSKFVRIGKNSDYLYPISAEDKRALSKFVRIGRQPLLNEPLSMEDTDINKRPSAFVRIGKSLSTSQNVHTSDISDGETGESDHKDSMMTD